MGTDGSSWARGSNSSRPTMPESPSASAPRTTCGASTRALAFAPWGTCTTRTASPTSTWCAERASSRARSHAPASTPESEQGQEHQAQRPWQSTEVRDPTAPTERRQRPTRLTRRGDLGARGLFIGRLGLNPHADRLGGRDRDITPHAIGGSYPDDIALARHGHQVLGGRAPVLHGREVMHRVLLRVRDGPFVAHDVRLIVREAVPGGGDAAPCVDGGLHAAPRRRRGVLPHPEQEAIQPPRSIALVAHVPEKEIFRPGRASDEI